MYLRWGWKTMFVESHCELLGQCAYWYAASCTKPLHTISAHDAGGESKFVFQTFVRRYWVVTAALTFWTFAFIVIKVRRSIGSRTDVLNVQHQHTNLKIDPISSDLEPKNRVLVEQTMSFWRIAIAWNHRRGNAFIFATFKTFPVHRRCR